MIALTFAVDHGSGIFDLRTSVYEPLPIARIVVPLQAVAAAARYDFVLGAVDKGWVDGFGKEVVDLELPPVRVHAAIKTAVNTAASITQVHTPVRPFVRVHSCPFNGCDDQRRGEAPSVAPSGSAALSSSDGELGYFGSWLE